ncbi:hypothetical protein PFICI_08501 [Pestalotiopsis fici W106-1]|uniref:BZIP domain-containing protein n=1 Tax=Pestalotiopsis fici (strain W106-1 / CGMCC3.15140) TaxID=1229662 RepID=W3WXR1_PESFW|nr:uncharacterized protein PFICI_08501 [Pestalotiopsis fici W106-1]ETS78648.1 hypothetical protein PFICI_08501 [Pestalotiopsis fici W106-1]
MSTTVFKFFQPKEQRQNPTEKRKDQLRRAQRTYRSRKEKYTRTLEAAFARAQAHEELLLKERARLRATVQRLVDTLNQNGIQPPEDCIQCDEVYNQDYMWVGSPTESSPSTSHGTNLSPQQIKESVHAVAGLTPQSDTTPESFQASSPIDGHLATSIVSQHGTTPICEFDEVAVGMDFILTIEKPCRGHIHGDPHNHDEPGGHAITATAQLCSPNHRDPRCHSPQATPLAADSDADTTRVSSAAILERLRNLSPLLCTPGESTPIQSWDLIRHHPGYGLLTQRDLWLLIERLGPSVKCHG